MGKKSDVMVYRRQGLKTDPNGAIKFGSVDVVGESHYEPAFRQILGKLKRGESRELTDLVAVLVREPRNKYDSNAIAVHVTDQKGNARKVGHPSSEDAEEYVDTIKKLERLCKGKVGCVARVYGRREGLIRTKEIYSAEIYVPDAEDWLGWRH